MAPLTLSTLHNKGPGALFGAMRGFGKELWGVEGPGIQPSHIWCEETR